MDLILNNPINITLQLTDLECGFYKDEESDEWAVTKFNGDNDGIKIENVELNMENINE